MKLPSPSTDQLLRPVSCARAVAAALAVVMLCSITNGASVSAEPSQRVAAAQSALVAATAQRVQADSRSEQLSLSVSQLQAEATRLGEQDSALTTEMVSSRQQLRDYAVAAYIDGGQSAIFRASLSPEKAVALSWQSTISIGQSSSANQAAQRFEALKAAAAPARASLAMELETASRELVEAQFDAIQAAGFERDAEAELAAAQSEQLATEAAAAQRAATEAAAAEAAATAGQQTPSDPSDPAAAPAEAAPGPPAFEFAVMGNPSAQESATLARIRRCESRGNYSIVSASGRYRGAYQFDFTTWRGVGGSGDPAAASPSEQDYRALLLLRLRGTRPWPICGR
ncbi:transglycosylase-like protein [Actinobacteria bacterium IMCC26207]|nr:transglycosylase-like protein [Actinobacteria bacterium IMCC26207]